MQELINRMEDTKRIATKNLIKSKHRTQRYYETKVKACSYSPGDLSIRTQRTPEKQIRQDIYRTLQNNKYIRKT